MKDNSIFEVLSQLEKDLNDIKSAKEQVDDVLQADSEISKNLAGYSQQLASIVGQLNSLIELIKLEMNRVITDVNSGVVERLAYVDKLVSNIDRLSSDIEMNLKTFASNHMDTLSKSCSNISDDFKSKVDKAVNLFDASIRNTRTKFSEETQGSVNKIAQIVAEVKSSVVELSDLKGMMFQKQDNLARDLSMLQNIEGRIGEDVSNIVSECSKQNNELHKANENIKQILTDLHNYETSLQNAVKYIEGVNNKNKEELKSMVKTNKMILFGIVVFAIIDIILRFI